MRNIKVSTDRNIKVFMTAASDHITGATGLTLTVGLSKADATTFSTITPTVTEISNGWYQLAMTGTHHNVLGDLAIHITAEGADPTDLQYEVVAYDSQSATTLGLSNLALLTDAIAELSADPGATPTVIGAIMLQYMAFRNQETVTATLRTIKNNAGTTILSQTLSDDGTTFTKAKVV
jgi:hypothetical protein